MKYAFYPGCVSRGATPELYSATIEICNKLGIDLDIESMRSASCTGSGVLQEKNERLGDTLNARNFALAEKSGNPLMTICSTCQGVMSQANKRLTESPDYLAEINQELAEEGLEYKGTIDPRHLLWIIIEDIGIDKLKSMIVRPLDGFKIAPFYGCYIVRPSSVLGFDENAESGHNDYNNIAQADVDTIYGSGTWNSLTTEERNIRLNVSNSALRSVDYKGGIDFYLKGVKSFKLSLRAKKFADVLKSDLIYIELHLLIA